MILRIFLILNFVFSCFWLSANCDFSFPIPKKEVGCMKYFDPEATGVNHTNEFFLAKMSELMYPERLDYQFQYLKNDQKTVKGIPSTTWIEENTRVNDDNFGCAFEARFRHYFPEEDSVEFQYVHRHRLDTINIIGMKYRYGLDPEMMIVSTKEYILILYRGTDKVKGDWMAEWTGTDLNIPLMPATKGLVETRVHRGFWQSYELIENPLIQHLEYFNARQKKIWVAGHSLGGGMSILTGAALESMSYDVQNVYTFASPRTIGNKAFKERLDIILPNKVHRFEYFMDPVTIMYAARYTNCGQRHWYNKKKNGKYDFFENIGERFVSLNPFTFRRRNKERPDKTSVRLYRHQFNGLIPQRSIKTHFHNPQWYVKAAYEQLSKEVRTLLPDVDDSKPFLYYGKKGSK